MKKTTIILLLIALCLLLCCCSVNSYRYPDSRRYTAGGAKVTGRVENLDVSWIDGHVTIGYHDGNGVLLSEECAKRLKEEDELHWWLDGDTLYVKYAESGVRINGNLDKELTVLLPEGTKLDKLTISAVSADLQTEELAAGTLKVNTVSGRVFMAVDSADTVECNAVSGDVRIAVERADHVKCNSVSGRQTLDFVREPANLTAESVSGNVVITLPGNAGFTADVDTVSGRVSGSMPMQKDGDTYTSGNGACRIQVDTVSGDVNLDARD